MRLDICPWGQAGLACLVHLMGVGDSSELLIARGYIVLLKPDPGLVLQLFSTLSFVAFELG